MKRSEVEKDVFLSLNLLKKRIMRYHRTKGYWVFCLEKYGWYMYYS